MTAFGLILCITLWIAGVDLLAVESAQAKQLGIEVPKIVGAMPIIVVAVYALVIVLLRKIPREKARWAVLLGATVLAFAAMPLASGSLHQKSVAIPLAAPLSQESLRKFDEAYHVKWIDSGKSIRVRREDYSEALADFLQKLAASPAQAPSHP